MPCSHFEQAGLDLVWHYKAHALAVTRIKAVGAPLRPLEGARARANRAPAARMFGAKWHIKAKRGFSQRSRDMQRSSAGGEQGISGVDDRDQFGQRGSAHQIPNVWKL